MVSGRLPTIALDPKDVPARQMAEHVVNLVDTQHPAVYKPENSESRPKMRRGFAGAGTG